jgi:triphosphoribosyl-dephospho-CoA synthase
MPATAARQVSAVASGPAAAPRAGENARLLAHLATRALIAEAELTPKPALVDRRGSGAHRDLTLASMRRSAYAIEPFFAEMAEAAAAAPEQRPTRALREQLAEIGRRAERAMLDATAGSNAHRGAIWALGLLTASASLHLAHDSAYDGARADAAAVGDREAPRDLARARLVDVVMSGAAVSQRATRAPSTASTQARERDRDLLLDPTAAQRRIRRKSEAQQPLAGTEWTLLGARCVAQTAAAIATFPDRTAPAPVSHGQRVERTYGVAGARGEAQQGFPHVIDVGLPMLRRRLRHGCSEDVARLDALLAIMSVLDDTCLLHRGGPRALAAAQHGARAALREGGAATTGGMRQLLALDALLLRLDASPGGSADLLSAAIFLDALSAPDAPRSQDAGIQATAREAALRPASRDRRRDVQQQRLAGEDDADSPVARATGQPAGERAEIFTAGTSETSVSRDAVRRAPVGSETYGND